MTDPFANLEHDLEGALPSRVEEKRFPCEHCHGTGRWAGGMNRHGSTECFACKGRGSFKTSGRDRCKARNGARASKARRVSNAREAFEAEYPDIMPSLSKMTDWNDFARSLVDQIRSKGALTDNQVAAAKRMIAKVAATRAKQTAERVERTEIAPVVDLAAIRQMFAKAIEGGLRRPTYRAEGLVISRAPDNGRNAGCLYVKTGNGDYQGKITEANKFLALREAATETAPALLVIAENPLEAAVRYGRMTGSCSCCGRELTNKASVEAGIGPICARKYGF